jgi:hypothetical protein
VLRPAPCDERDTRTGSLREHAAHEALAGAGVDFTVPPATPPWNPRGRYALLRDSEGNIVMLQS